MKSEHIIIVGLLVLLAVVLSFGQNSGFGCMGSSGNFGLFNPMFLWSILLVILNVIVLKPVFMPEERRKKK